MARLDLNCDLGEGVGDDAAIFPLISSANIACGYHAGDAATMRAACTRARENGVVIGAHPSYRDREGLGRRVVEISRGALHAEVMEQIASLRAAAEAAGADVRYLKPHGALYNRIVTDSEQAVAVAEAARDSGLPLLGLAGSALHRAAQTLGVRFVREAFADRGYRADGTLAPRGTPGALLTDPETVARRALQIALTGTVDTVDGSLLTLEVDSICLHGDTPAAESIAAAVREALLGAGVEIEAFA